MALAAPGIAGRRRGSGRWFSGFGGKGAKQMINNADIVLRTDKLVSEGKLQNSHIEKMVEENAKAQVQTE